MRKHPISATTGIGCFFGFCLQTICLGAGKPEVVHLTQNFGGFLRVANHTHLLGCVMVTEKVHNRPQRDCGGLGRRVAKTP